jgi:hypothetical protein
LHVSPLEKASGPWPLDTCFAAQHCFFFLLEPGSSLSVLVSLASAKERETQRYYNVVLGYVCTVTSGSIHTALFFPHFVV